MVYADAVLMIQMLNAANYLGFNDWRLPATLEPDGSCRDDPAGTEQSSDPVGWHCTGSELGHLYYEEIDGIASEDNSSMVPSGDPAEIAKFSNLQSGYWSTYTTTPSTVYRHQFNAGKQQNGSEASPVTVYTLAVRDGDPTDRNLVQIIDADVEGDGDWVGTIYAWQASGVGFLTPGHLEGANAAAMNGGGALGVHAIWQVFSSHYLQPGIYSVEFAVGDYDNYPFPVVNAVLSNVNLADAYASFTPTPVPGTWKRWKVVWDIRSNNPNVGGPLSFALGLTGPVVANLAFDGVGNLSPNGNGVLISYAPPFQCDIDDVIGFSAGELLMLERHLLGLESLDGWEQDSCDMNSDGLLSVADLILLEQLISDQ